MTNELNIGIIGAGMVSQIAHLPAFKQAFGCQLSALAEHNREIARNIASRFQISKVYSSHHELLADPNIQAVVIVIHRYDTAVIVKDALLAGKHVFCEKPIALRSDIVKELLTIAHAKKLVLAIGFMKRHDLCVRQLKELINSNQCVEFGEMVSVRSRHYCNKYVGNCNAYLPFANKKKRILCQKQMPSWLPKHKWTQYDWFMNIACHTINLLQYLFGDDINVKYTDFSKQLSAMFLLEVDKIPIVADMGKVSTGKWEESIEVYFEKARLEITLTSLMERDQNATLTIDKKVAGKGHIKQVLTPEGPWSFVLQAQNFVDVIAGRSRLQTSEQEGLRGVEIIEQLWKHFLNVNPA